jgi:hypothetical protein
MNGSEDATCLTYPIVHARDTDKSGSLKKKYLLFQKKKDLVDSSSSESVRFPYTLNLEILTLNFEEKSRESDDRYRLVFKILRFI